MGPNIRGLSAAANGARGLGGDRLRTPGRQLEAALALLTILDVITTMSPPRSGPSGSASTRPRIAVARSVPTMTSPISPGREDRDHWRLKG
jgi:hypothetical protein